MACKAYGCFKSRMNHFKSYLIVVLVVVAIVVFQRGEPSRLKSVKQSVTFKTKPVTLPLCIVNDHIPKPVATGAGTVDRTTNVLSRISEARILTAKRLSPQPLGHLNAQTTLSPYFDRHVIGMQIKITF